MKINKAELLQIIKEEAGKLKRTRTLIAERAAIEKQLQECGCALEEGEADAKREALVQQFNTLHSAGASGDLNRMLEKATTDNYNGKLSVVRTKGAQNPADQGRGISAGGKRIIVYTQNLS